LKDFIYALFPFFSNNPNERYNLKIDIRSSCIDFAEYVCEHWVDPSITMEELWEEYQIKMNKEVMAMLDACNNPPEPNDKLKEAAIKYADTIKEAEPTPKEIR